MIKRYYAVRKGRKNNVVVNSWDECEKLVKGYSGAIYKGFKWLEDAEKFAVSGDYGKWTPKEKKETVKSVKGKCLERKSYRCPRTGIYFKNRCVMRQGAIITGENYVPSDDVSVPW